MYFMHQQPDNCCSEIFSTWPTGWLPPVSANCFIFSRLLDQCFFFFFLPPLPLSLLWNYYTFSSKALFIHTLHYQRTILSLRSE